MKKSVILAMMVFFLFGLTSYAKMPSYKSLCGAMQNIEGWSMDEECSGSNMSGTPMGEVVVATKSFTKGDKRLELSVLSGMRAMASWNMFQTNISVETNENIVKTTTIQGYKGGISYDKKENSGVVYICLKHPNDQCNVLFAFNFENMNYKDVVYIAEHYNLKAVENVF